MKTRSILVVSLLLLAASWSASAERIRPEGVDGALLLRGPGVASESAWNQFVKLAGGEKAHLVVLELAADNQAAETALAELKKRKPASLVAHRFKKADAETAKLLKASTGVWLVGTLAADASIPASLSKELAGVQKRDGIVAGPLATLARLDLLPDGLIASKESKKLASVVGVDIDKHSSLLIHGRRLRSLGKGTTTLRLAASKTRPARTIELTTDKYEDLTALRRSARARNATPFPPAQAAVPEVTGGSLVVVGGGGMPADVTKKFIELAGGPDALIVVLPTAMPDPIPKDYGGAFFKRAGAKNVHVLPGRKLSEVEAKDALDVLKKAKGIWFGGGRQWRFVDAYEGTKAEAIMHDVLRRGGVIGGSSAGATIQGGYLCRGSPFGNREIMYEGYERGLGFLPGVAIDQHFAQRKRFADMAALKKTFPQLLGIGIDEATALIVKGHVADVMGKSQAHFYGGKDDRTPHESVPAGGRYDLKARKVLEVEKK